MSRRQIVTLNAVACTVLFATFAAVTQFPIATTLSAQTNLSAQTKQVFQPGDGVTLPRVIKEVKPEYTQAAMAERIQGSIWLKVVVLETGDVGDVEITRSLDDKYGLDDEAVKAARQWRFEPGKKGGKAVPVKVTLELTFTLK